MGRSFESLRMGVNALSERWHRASRDLREDDREYGERIARMARRHASECFYNFDHPLEAAVFSALIEIAREAEERVDL